MASTWTGGSRWAAAFAAGQQARSLWKGGTAFWRAAPVTLVNLIPNGSFETDTAGWAASHTLTRVAASPAHAGEAGTWMGQNSGTVNGAIWIQRSAALPAVSGHRYYLRALVQYGTSTFANIVQFFNAATALAGVATMTIPAVNTWAVYDAVWAANTASLQLRVNATGGNGNQARTGRLDNVLMLDLTATFGSSEPPLASLRSMIAAAGGWWEGSTTV